LTRYNHHNNDKKKKDVLVEEDLLQKHVATTGAPGKVACAAGPLALLPRTSGGDSSVARIKKRNKEAKMAEAEDVLHGDAVSSDKAKGIICGKKLRPVFGGEEELPFVSPPGTTKRKKDDASFGKSVCQALPLLLKGGRIIGWELSFLLEEKIAFCVFCLH